MSIFRNAFIAIGLGLVLGGLIACSEQQEPAVIVDIDPALEDPALTLSVSADWILTNGQILTVDADFSSVQAMAIKDGRIVATGPNEEVMTYSGPDTEYTDLDGQTVIPGLIDNHMHFVRATKHWYRMVRWEGITSRAEALEMLRERSAQLPEGEWLMVLGGFIFDQFKDDTRIFTRQELDEISTNRPIYILSLIHI